MIFILFFIFIFGKNDFFEKFQTHIQNLCEHYTGYTFKQNSCFFHIDKIYYLFFFCFVRNYFRDTFLPYGKM